MAVDSGKPAKILEPDALRPGLGQTFRERLRGKGELARQDGGCANRHVRAAASGEEVMDPTNMCKEGVRGGRKTRAPYVTTRNLSPTYNTRPHAIDNPPSHFI